MIKASLVGELPHIIKSVTNALIKLNVKNIVLDPVMVAKGGHRLIDTKSIKILKKQLLKISEIFQKILIIIKSILINFNKFEYFRI